jgi:hypothetical protein
MRLTETRIDGRTGIVACVWQIDNLLIGIDFIFSESLRQGQAIKEKKSVK